jgi:DNA invertase Pin-like site-specific DNA recombinase
MAAEMERDLIRERTLDGLRAAEAQGRHGGRRAAVNDDVLAIARARQSRGESVTAIARHLKIGRSTLYRALQSREGDLASAAAVGQSDKAPDSAEDSLPFSPESHTLGRDRSARRPEVDHVGN